MENKKALSEKDLEKVTGGGIETSINYGGDKEPLNAGVGGVCGDNKGATVYGYNIGNIRGDSAGGLVGSGNNSRKAEPLTGHES